MKNIDCKTFNNVTPLNSACVPQIPPLALGLARSSRDQIKSQIQSSVSWLASLAQAGKKNTPPALGLADCLWFCVNIPPVTASGWDLLRYRWGRKQLARNVSLSWFAKFTKEALVAWIRHAPHRPHTSRPAHLPHFRVQVFRCSNSCTEPSARGSLQQGTVKDSHGGSKWRIWQLTNTFLCFCSA